MRYWQRGAYLGIGAGAHSFASTRPWGHRWANARLPDHYMEQVAVQGHAIVSEERPSREQAIGEFLFLGLRLLEGIDPEDFAAQFSTPLSHARPGIDGFIAEGFLETTAGRLRLTRTGILHADTVFAALL